jgi:aspartate/methionine/tyrosine aminotransferase
MILEKVKALEYSKIRALNQLANNETINLGIGRPYCKTPEYIKAAGIKAISDDQTYYSSNYGIKVLRDEISKRYSRGNFNNALVTIGAAEGIYLTMRSFLETGDEVLIPNPGYLAYEPIAKLTGASCKFYELTESHQINFQSLSKNISKATKMLVIYNPGNPPGVDFKE